MLISLEDSFELANVDIKSYIGSRELSLRAAGVIARQESQQSKGSLNQKKRTKVI